MRYIVLQVPTLIDGPQMTSSTGDELECADTAGNAKITFCIECIGLWYQLSSDNPQEISMYYSQH
jgi:hypothetical protein